MISALGTSGDSPVPQYGQAVTLHDDYLYVVGGTTGFEYSCDVYRCVTNIVREEAFGKIRFDIRTFCPV